MRRFIVEVILDALLLLVIVLFLGIISVGQPFPFGPNGNGCPTEMIPRNRTMTRRRSASRMTSTMNRRM